MKLLLDTHAVIWWVDQDHLLSPSAHAAIGDPANDLLLSAGTIWEIAIKVGPLVENVPLVSNDTIFD